MHWGTSGWARRKTTQCMNGRWCSTSSRHGPLFKVLESPLLYRAMVLIVDVYSMDEDRLLFSAVGKAHCCGMDVALVDADLQISVFTPRTDLTEYMHRSTFRVSVLNVRTGRAEPFIEGMGMRRDVESPNNSFVSRAIRVAVPSSVDLAGFMYVAFAFTVEPAPIRGTWYASIMRPVELMVLQSPHGGASAARLIAYKCGL